MTHMGQRELMKRPMVTEVGESPRLGVDARLGER